MNPVKIISAWICIVLMVSHASQLQAEAAGKELIKQLEQAEIHHDIAAIRRLYAEDAVIYVPDNMPFAGRPAIVSLYEYLWESSANKTVDYRVERTERVSGNYIEHGTNNSVDGTGKQRTSTFKAVYRPSGSGYVIEQLVFNDAEAITPRLPAPTGEYDIGQARFFHAADATESGRILAFQVWYPAAASDGELLKQHSIETTAASARFLGLPPFALSYGSIVSSHSVLEAQAAPGRPFPVVLYNHGYGGFTSVYQTVFEELASHGYVVVSIGHQDESSLFIQGDGAIVTTSPDNDFYASRAPELEGAKINALQATILNSDNVKEVAMAYGQLVQLSPLHNESTRLWAMDTVRVIDRLRELNKEDSILKGVLDLDAIGVMGHSVGGATAGQLAFGNPAIKAGINLDGFQFGDLVNNTIEIPFMFVSSNQAGNTYLRAANFIEQSKADCYQAVLSGFTHGSFTDLTYFQSGGPASVALQRDLLRGFFDKYLKDMDLSLEALDQRYPELTIRP